MPNWSALPPGRRFGLGKSLCAAFRAVIFNIAIGYGMHGGEDLSQDVFLRSPTLASYRSAHGGCDCDQRDTHLLIDLYGEASGPRPIRWTQLTWSKTRVTALATGQIGEQRTVPTATDAKLALADWSGEPVELLFRPPQLSSSGIGRPGPRCFAGNVASTDCVHDWSPKSQTRRAPNVSSPSVR